jgi:hypothetical protein
VTCYDIFNGDADGICALQQLRLVEPRDAELVTGLKRDINLVERVPAQAGDELVVLDVSFDRNRDGVRRALDAGARVFYADHHYAGELIDSDRLELHIHTHAETCTSLIVNALQQDAHPGWAVAGAYGDNLYDSADSLARRLGMPQAQRDSLRELGTCLNYNGYGFELEDLVFHPAELYQLVKPHRDPLGFVETPAYRCLLEAYRQDLEASRSVEPYQTSPEGAIYILPDEPWARRVNGVFSNDLARAYPQRAHAVLTPCGAGCYRVSVRAPLTRKTGADRLCRQFASGGGREAAAGINRLDESDLSLFSERFSETFRGD